MFKAKGLSNNKCSSLNEEVFNQNKAGGGVLAGTKKTTTNEVLVKNGEFKMSNYCLTGPKVNLKYILISASLFNFLFWSPAWVKAEDDVPSQKEEMTIDEAKVLKKWNPKDPNIGFEGEDDEGNYYYEQTDGSLEKEVGDEDKIEPKKENYDKGLRSVMSDGSYLFETEESEQSGSFSVHAGPMTAPLVVNSEGTKFSDIYSDKPLGMVFIDYSWQAQMFGKWGLTIGSGVGQATAPGRFRSDPNEEALEKYTIYVIPNHLSFSYRFQYTKAPYLAPYISGGVSAFAFAERRDDNRKTKGIVARGVQAAGGIKINIGLLDPHGAFTLDSEYGINNVWFDVEYKLVKGVQADRDISSNIINGGISFDF